MIRDAGHRNRVMRRGARVEKIDWDRVYERDGGICQWCKKRLKREEMSLDHIWPVIRGGQHTYENVQAVHRRCNNRKQAYGPGQLRLIG